jgi:molybdenum cofactor cytidylyltransferase
MPPTVYAILLAAGRSTRMGQPKPLLPWGQSTVIESCVDHLFCGGVQEVTVVLNPQSESIRQSLASTSAGIVINDIPNCEMGVSISRGAEQLPVAPGAILLALADQPAIPSEVIQALISVWRKGDALVVIPTRNGRGGHPILLDGSLKSRLLKLDPQLGLRGILQDLRNQTVRLEVESPYILRDIDTWEEYEALHWEVFGLAPASKP